ncbi:MAG TPA: hypothetical protein PKA05_01245, partial [Roseiflexaceae bacterium]|nr:hypothetical protein [Roseiflexaceae bacterium]
MRQSDDSLRSPHQLLAHLGRGLRSIRAFSVDRLLAVGLYTLLLLCYAIVSYIVVLAAASMFIPAMLDPFAPVPWWLNITALV